MSPCQGTLGVQWHSWVLGEHAQHQPSPGLGGHHWHCIGSQRSLQLGPLHVFSVDWTQLHTCGLPTWGSVDGHCVPPQCNHVQWCYQWFWYIQGTLWGTGPSSSGRCPVSRPDQREDAGNSTSQRGCWRQLRGLILHQGLWTSIHDVHRAWWSNVNLQICVWLLLQ